MVSKNVTKRNVLVQKQNGQKNILSEAYLLKANMVSVHLMSVSTYFVYDFVLVVYQNLFCTLPEITSSISITISVCIFFSAKSFPPFQFFSMKDFLYFVVRYFAPEMVFLMIFRNASGLKVSYILTTQYNEILTHTHLKHI